MDGNSGLVDLMVHYRELNEHAEKALSTRLKFDASDVNASAVRATLTKCPQSKFVLDQCGLPFGFLVEPFRGPLHTVAETVASCYNCDAYVNPYTKITNEDEWTCNLCGVWNSLKVQNQNAQLCGAVQCSSVEFCRTRPEHLTFADAESKKSRVSLAETYLYVFDVSSDAVHSGYLRFVADIILCQLDAVAAGSPSARIGFIAFSNEIHLYRLNVPGGSRLEKFILTDLDEMKEIRRTLIARSCDFLLNVREDKDLIADFLRHLADEYQETTQRYSALGPTLHAVYEIMRANGGRVTIFQGGQPSICKTVNGRCSFAECSDESYRYIGKQCRYQAITLDLFLLGGRCMELPTLSVLHRETGGSIFRFPDFSSGDPLQTVRLERTLRRYLTRFIGFSSVMKIYLSTGLSLVRSYSGYYQANEDGELEINVAHPDVAVSFDVTVDHQLLSREREVYFQVAVSYTSKNGEYLTRIHTLNLPVSCDVGQVVHSADAECIAGLWAKQISTSMMDSFSVDKTRQLLSNFCCKFLKVHKTSQAAAAAAAAAANETLLQVPSNLKLLPYYVFNILNCNVFKEDVKTLCAVDKCAHLLYQFSSLPLCQLLDVVNPVSYQVYPEIRRTSFMLPLQASSTKCHLLKSEDVLYFAVGDGVNDSSPFLAVVKSVEELAKWYQPFSEELGKLVDLMMPHLRYSINVIGHSGIVGYIWRKPPTVP